MNKYFLTILYGFVLCQGVCASHQETEKEDYSHTMLPVREAHTEKEVSKIRQFVNAYYHIHIPFYDAVVEINRSFAPNEKIARTAHRVLFIPQDIKSQMDVLKQKSESTFEFSGIDLKDHKSTLYENSLEEKEDLLNVLSYEIKKYEDQSQQTEDIKTEKKEIQNIETQTEKIKKLNLSERYEASVEPVKKQLINREMQTESNSRPFYKSPFFTYPMVALGAGSCVYFYMKK